MLLTSGLEDWAFRPVCHKKGCHQDFSILQGAAHPQPTLSDHSQNVGQIKTQPIMRFFRSPLRQIPQREWLSSQNVRESVRSHCFDYPDFKSKPVDVR